MTETGPRQRATDARRKRAEALATVVQGLTRRALGRRALAEAGLMADWPAVVGADTARACWPRALRFPRAGTRRAGTLVLRVRAGEAPRIGHRSEDILAQVNGYFGYKAVAELRLEQGPPPRGAGASRKPPTPGPDSAAEAAAARVTSGVADPDLRAALTRLGGYLETRRRGNAP